MPGIPEGIESSDKFKLTLLQIEKRFVDIEIALGELKEAFSSLEQRIDDIEDLIMVEQAGLIELKKMLEMKSEEPTVTETPVTEEFKNVVVGLSREIEEKTNLNKREIAAIKTRIWSIERMIKDIDMKLERSEKTEEIDVGSLVSKFKEEDEEIELFQPKPKKVQVGEIEEKLDSLEGKLKEIGKRIGKAKLE